MYPKRTRVLVAERVGFEPTIRYDRIPDLQSGAFVHSATSPAMRHYRAWQTMAEPRDGSALPAMGQGRRALRERALFD